MFILILSYSCHKSTFQLILLPKRVNDKGFRNSIYSQCPYLNICVECFSKITAIALGPCNFFYQIGIDYLIFDTELSKESQNCYESSSLNGTSNLVYQSLSYL